MLIWQEFFSGNAFYPDTQLSLSWEGDKVRIVADCYAHCVELSGDAKSAVLFRRYLRELFYLLTEKAGRLSDLRSMRELEELEPELGRLGVYPTAEETNLSLVYVCQIFKKEVGMTFKAYLTKVRIREARRRCRPKNIR